MAYYYKIEKPPLPSSGIQIYDTNSKGSHSETYDFSKHVLIELLDDVTPETKLWEELGLTFDKNIIHKRMMVDSHRGHCRRAVVVCASANQATQLAQRLSQTKIMRRCVCATVVQDLLFDFKLYEKQILTLGDKRPQHQLLYITDLNRNRKPAALAKFLRELFSPFGTVLSVFVSEDKDGFAHPEGVVKFAYLSEAFAAELAYDQYIMGMERLSVTTHHNILLSQCDLRVRLREAQRNTSHSNLFPDSAPVDNSTIYSKQPYVNSPFSVSDSELEDVLKNPCKSNMEKALCSSSLSSHPDCGDDPSSRVTLLLKEQDWSSRIKSWIADSDSLHSKANPNKMVPLIKNAAICESSSMCSFKTCENSTQNCVESLLSPSGSSKSSLSGFDETIERFASSPESFHTTKDNRAQVLSQCSFLSSISQKGNNSCSDKLSLRKQNKNSLLLLKSQLSLVSTRNLESHNIQEDSPKVLKIPFVCLKRLSPTEIQNLCHPQSPSKCQRYDSVFSVSSNKENYLFVNQRSSSQLKFSRKNESRPELTPSTGLCKSDSPLRFWLKNDLLIGSNINVFDNIENTRKVVYATANKNVLAHVGCSHITCDICYPGSTNLLLGCH